jgi:hypothetical protein
MLYKSRSGRAESHYWCYSGGTSHRLARLDNTLHRAVDDQTKVRLAWCSRDTNVAEDHAYWRDLHARTMAAQFFGVP